MFWDGFSLFFLPFTIPATKTIKLPYLGKLHIGPRRVLDYLCFGMFLGYFSAHLAIPDSKL